MAVSRQRQQIAANPTAQVEDDAGGSMAVEPAGVLLRHIPRCCLFQCLGRKEEVFGVDKLGGGAAAQASQRHECPSLVGVKAAAKGGEYCGQVGIAERGVPQFFCCGASLGRQEKWDRRRADGADDWHSSRLYMLEW